MEAHVTFHAEKEGAATMAGMLRQRGLQVAIAGPVDQTFLRNDGDYPDDRVDGKRWIVLATESGLTVVD